MPTGNFKDDVHHGINQSTSNKLGKILFGFVFVLQQKCKRNKEYYLGCQAEILLINSTTVIHVWKENLLQIR